MTTNDTHMSFVRAVVAEPDEDAHRLVFADWLEDQGGEANLARAEHIRTHCRILGGEVRKEEIAPWERREHQIVKKHESAWLEADGINLPLLGVSFHKGFPERVAIDKANLGGCATGLFARAPVRSLSLQALWKLYPDTPYLWAHLLAYLATARLTQLTLTVKALGHGLARALRDCPHLDGLEHLTVRAESSERAATRMLRRKFGKRFYRGA